VQYPSNLATLPDVPLFVVRFTCCWATRLTKPIVPLQEPDPAAPRTVLLNPDDGLREGIGMYYGMAIDHSHQASICRRRQTCAEE